MKNLYYVYIIKCSDKSYYTGITNNLHRRVGEHNEGINLYCYTYTRRPVELVFSQEFTDVNEAIIFEKKLKGWSRAKKETLIENRLENLPKLSKNKKDSSTSSE
ncbi:GIY-YIG nuclease family protein [Empedobacter falsenii]|uniref:GIY-YIG nuclease family protein n=1 Tax=Empedobacter falsenii TaxID=343874 RepID=A0ABY8V6G4_9FLAO|nr:MULTISPECIES: GIY-YIG nuclease family protein [Empedobacter]MCA4777118.1 GIY-YIG nuclease family protein [Empedobacter stercoris]MDM1522161.1 GIY-YIG nuclease family protein [Empedobacter sp. 225-1]MDM1542456.1 GIY-YIG nuclease family protein [Empedobacter sp. 189-2]WIH96947.1 GIY-YIG nuclease family protein [Empedobacter falsenii]HJD87583.1 GIY-YIG nuclease family protein [Empedobacter falsenii]